MQTSPDQPLAGALFRVLAARPGYEAVGLYRSEPDGPRLVAASAAFRALLTPRDTLAPPKLPAGTGACRIDPAGLALTARFAAAATVARPGSTRLGWLVVADRRALRLTAGKAMILTDAAALAAPLLEAADRPRDHRYGDAAAQRRIDDALARRGGNTALMLLDLDRFRSVREALGPAAGRAVLAATAARLERVVAGRGRLLRLGGDRFVVIAAVGASEAPALAGRMLQAIREPIALDGRTLVVHASAGIVVAPPAGADATLQLSQADAALRRAKAEGRNRFVLHEPAEAVAALETTRLELDLAGALAGRQFHLVHQPFLDLRSGEVSGVEALLRWQHPTRGTLLPAAFIPMAEANGQILPLGQWALREALGQAARWRAPLGLAVNISPLQFHQPDFLANIDAALAASGFPPGRLELEITETVLMRDSPDTTALLRALIARGIRIALDDFGTGYSALAYLARLPHHRIKLDKAFVQDLANPATAQLIRAILALARAQGVAVTAEGVEQTEDLARVRRMGFTHAQGYAIGSPTADPSALVAAAADVQACAT